LRRQLANLARADGERELRWERRLRRGLGELRGERRTVVEQRPIERGWLEQRGELIGRLDQLRRVERRDPRRRRLVEQ
jgi:hypothetical protein